MIHKAILALMKNLYYKYMKNVNVLATYSVIEKRSYNCTINITKGGQNLLYQKNIKIAKAKF